jgi:hypothetical protein
MKALVLVLQIRAGHGEEEEQSKEFNHVSQ